MTTETGTAKNVMTMLNLNITKENKMKKTYTTEWELTEICGRKAWVREKITTVTKEDKLEYAKELAEEIKHASH